ncbi:unnamed protein product [Vitrella brassicaformis CCMP3155]|uniref:Uncharacterized protein n=1 Tax=Vitrella brassicaformis (strain CCMP3155) TaxID=1169540 RepID=A0A0G4FR01_VITBC|nr:unnamed protein product [Vitrella brassicaformis CCMP3155]|eukprot:CEM16651.1 unnamed protein product [Vitrella brassicaformis CCMP3155]
MLSRSVGLLFARGGQAAARRLPAAVGGVRQATEIIKDKGSAEENIYFHQEDETLLRKLLTKHPEWDPRFSGKEEEEKAEVVPENYPVDQLVYEDLKDVCSKYDMSANLSLVRDVIVSLERHGWRHPKFEPVEEQEAKAK